MDQATGRSLRVLVIAKDDPSFDWDQLSLQEEHYDIVGRFNSVSQAWKRIQRGQVDIVLADTSGEGVLATEWIQTVTIQASGTLVIVIATNLEMDFIRQAMLKGAHGFLLKPFDLPELSHSIEQVYQLWLQRNALLAEATNGTAKSTKKAYTIAVFSPKGGSGVTAISVNLAVALKQLTNAPVLLVDADLQTADVDIFLNIFNKLSILDLINVEQEVDHELLQQVATEHATGITVLQGNPNLQFVESPVDAGQMSALIEELMSLWEGYIVFNTSNSLDRATVEVIDAVDTVLLVTTPQLSTLRVIRNFLDLAEIYDDPSGKWQVIMNSYQSQKALRMSDIEESIHYPIKATIAQDINLVSTSINRGTPLILSDTKSAVARDIQALAKQIMEANNSWPQQSQMADNKQKAVEKEEAAQSKSGKRFWQFFTGTSRSASKIEQPIS